MAKDPYEYEFTADGHLQHSAHSIQQAWQAYREGNIQPFLHLLADPNLTGAGEIIKDIRLSPHLQRLLIDVVTGRLKRPNHRGKTDKPLTITEITDIGMRVRNLMTYPDTEPCMDRQDCCKDPLQPRRPHPPLKYRAAIKKVAEGIPALKAWTREEMLAFLAGLSLPPTIPALKDLNGEEILDGSYLPPIPIKRVKAAYAAFLKLQREPRPWDTRLTTTKSSRPKRSASKP